MTHYSHVTRMSDSSHYDIACVLCGGTDGSGDLTLDSPCRVGSKHHPTHERTYHPGDRARIIYCRHCKAEGDTLSMACLAVVGIVVDDTDSELTMITPRKSAPEPIVAKIVQVPRGTIVEVKTPHGPVHGKPDALWYVLDLVEQDRIRQEVGPHLSITGAGFTKDLQALINAYSIDADLGVPDFILAQIANNLLMTFGNGMAEVRRYEGKNEILEELKFEPVDPKHKDALYRRETPPMEWYP